MEEYKSGLLVIQCISGDGAGEIGLMLEKDRDHGFNDWIDIEWWDGRVLWAFVEEWKKTSIRWAIISGKLYQIKRIFDRKSSFSCNYQHQSNKIPHEKAYCVGEIQLAEGSKEISSIRKLFVQRKRVFELVDHDETDCGNSSQASPRASKCLYSRILRVRKNFGENESLHHRNRKVIIRSFLDGIPIIDKIKVYCAEQQVRMITEWRRYIPQPPQLR